MPSVFDLVATLSLDSSEYEEGIEKSKKSGLSKLGSGLKAVGAIGVAAMGATASAMGAFAVSSVNAGKDFDQAMAQVAATMGKSVDEVKNLNEFAQEMGRTTAFSATESAEALNYMALAGYDAETSMNMLPNVLNLAAAGNFSLSRASDMVTDAQSALGLSLEETTEMVDKMARASSKSNTSVEQLGDAFLTIGGTAKTLSGGTTELATALGILADNGIKGAEGGTALRNILLNLTPKNKEAAEAMASIGLEAYDAEGNMRSLKDIFGDMSEAMKDMTTQERTNLISAMFNKVDLKTVNALIGTTGERWDELTTAIDNSQNAAQEMAETQLDNLAGDITLFKSALEGAKIAVSDTLTPSLREFVQFGTDGLSEMTAAFKEDGLSGAMDVFSRLLDDALTTISDGFPDVLDTVLNVLDGVADSLIKNAPKIIKALGKALIKIVKSISKKAPDITKAAVDLFLNLADGLTEALPDIIKGIAEAIPQITKALLEHSGDILKAGVKLFITLGTSLIKAIPDIVKEIPTFLAELGKGILEGAGELISGLANAFVEETTKIDEAEQQLIDSIKAERDELDLTMQKREEANSSIDDQYEYYDTLWTKLQSIVDENGKVKDGYEDQAQVITTVLSDALGIEIEMVDGVIQKYSELKGSIEETMKAREAEALLNANRDEYETALSNVKKSYDELIEAQNNYNDTSRELEETQQRLAAAQKEIEEASINGNHATFEQQENYRNLEDEVELLTQALAEEETALNNAQKSYSDYNAIIEQQQGLMTAIATGDYQDLSDAINNVIYDWRSATTSTEEELQKQVDGANAHLQSIKKAYEEGNSKVTAETIQEAIRRKDLAEQELRNFQAMAETETEEIVESQVRPLDENHDRMRQKETDLVNQALAAAGDMVPLFADPANNYASTMLSTLDQWRGRFKIYGHDLAADLLSGVNEGFGINSPSREARWIGNMFGEGLQLGIDESIPDVSGISDKLLSDTEKSLSELPISGDGGTFEFVSSEIKEQMNQIMGVLSEYLPQVANMQLVTDTGVLVGELAPGLDEQFGQMVSNSWRNN